MDKDFIKIDDLVRMRTGGVEQQERSGSWHSMRELLDKEMPQEKPAGVWNFRRTFSMVAALSLLASVGIGGYELRTRAADNAVAGNMPAVQGDAVQKSAEGNNANQPQQADNADSKQLTMTTDAPIHQPEPAAATTAYADERNAAEDITVPVNSNNTAEGRNKPAAHTGPNTATGTKAIDKATVTPLAAVIPAHAKPATAPAIANAATATDNGNTAIAKNSIKSITTGGNAMSSDKLALGGATINAGNNNVPVTTGNIADKVMDKSIAPANKESKAAVTAAGTKPVGNSMMKPAAVAPKPVKPAMDNAALKNVSVMNISKGKKVIERMVLHEHYIKTASNEGYFKLDTISIETLTDELGLRSENGTHKFTSTHKTSRATAAGEQAASSAATNARQGASAKPTQSIKK